MVQFAFDVNKAKIVFDDYRKDCEMSEKIRKIFNPNNDLSYVWIDEDENIVKTSKHIRMTLNTVKAVLLLWNKNKVKHGYKIDG